MASPRTLDFSKMERKPVMSPKQIRARARRRMKAGKSAKSELELLYRKPVDEWDREELARGRPRDKDGYFRGATPSWVSRVVYEEALDRFKRMIREDVQEKASGALDIVYHLMTCEDLDDKGKPIVPASVKLDAAKWLTEHIIGKPTQRVENDISIKLQAVMAQAMVPIGTHLAELPPAEQVVGAAADTSVWEAESEEDDDA